MQLHVPLLLKVRFHAVSFQRNIVDAMVDAPFHNSMK